MDASGHISRSRDPDICLSEYILVEADLLLFFAGAPRAALHLSGSLFHDHLKAVGTTGSHWQCARPLIAWRPFAWRAYSRNGIPRQLEVVRLEQEIKFIKLHKDEGNVSLIRLCRPIPASSAIDRHPSLRTQYEWAKVWHKKSLTRCQEFKSAPKMDGFLSVLRDTDANDNDKDENSQCAGFHEDILTEDHRIVRKVQRTPRGGQRGRRRRGSGSTPHTDHSQEGIRRLRSGRTIARMWLHQRITGIDKVLAWARLRRAVVCLTAASDAGALACCSQSDLQDLDSLCLCILVDCKKGAECARKHAGRPVDEDGSHCTASGQKSPGAGLALPNRPNTSSRQQASAPASKCSSASFQGLSIKTIDTYNRCLFMFKLQGWICPISQCEFPIYDIRIRIGIYIYLDIYDIHKLQVSRYSLIRSCFFTYRHAGKHRYRKVANVWLGGQEGQAVISKASLR